MSEERQLSDPKMLVEDDIIEFGQDEDDEEYEVTYTKVACSVSIQYVSESDTQLLPDVIDSSYDLNELVEDTPGNEYSLSS